MLKHRRGSKRGLVVYVPLCRTGKYGLNFALDMSTISFAIQDVSMLKVFEGIIQSYSTPFQGVAHQAASLSLRILLTPRIKKIAMKANCAIGRAACAVKALTCSTL